MSARTLLSGSPDNSYSSSASTNPFPPFDYPSFSSSSSDSGSCSELPFKQEQPSPPVSRKYFTQSSSSKLRIAHPYTRLFAKKDDTKRRRIWNHALEKLIFNPYELSTLGAPHRRTIYLASLEAHIDKLHAQLFKFGCCPVTAAELEPFRGLNSKTAKSMVSNLQHEVSEAKLKLLELERANAELECLLRESSSGAAEYPCPVYS